MLKLRAVSILGLGLLVLTGCPSNEAPAPEASAPAAPASQPAAPPAAPASQPSALVHGLPNPSGIRYVDPACDGKTPCKCAGQIKYGQNALAQIDVSEARLAEGVYCVFGDFDGNGQADVAIMDGAWTPEGGKAGDVRVLLFDGLGLRAAVPMPKKMLSVGRDEVEGQQVLVEPAAAQKYYFAFREGRFELLTR